MKRTVFIVLLLLILFGAVNRLSARSLQSTEEFTEPPSTVTFSSSDRSKDSIRVREDEVIKVNVKWNDFEESFELHNKSIKSK